MTIVRNIIITGFVGLIAAMLLTQGGTKKEGQIAQGQITTYQAPYQNAQVQFYQYLLDRPWSNIVKKYMAEQAQNEQALLHEIFTLVGIDEHKFNECKIAFQGHYSKAQEEEFCEIGKDAKKQVCDHATLIFDFLNTYKINVCSMKILSTDKKGFAIAHQSNLYIDDEVIFNTTNNLNDLGKAFILHEMQHVMHNDSFNIFVVKILFDTCTQKCPDKIKECDALLSRYLKFTENRADVLAGLVDPLYARVSSNFYAEKVERGQGDIEFDTHPTYENRYAYLDNLHKEMIQVV